MTLDRRFLNWGVFFIVLGAVPLAVHQGLLTTDVLDGAWRLWPLILVGLGLGILLHRTPAAVVGGLVVAATFGLVFGSALAVGPDVVVGCGGAVGSGSAFDQHGTLNGNASVDVSIGCGTLTVSTQQGSDWTLHATNSQNVSPRIDSSPDSLSVRSGRTGDFPWIDGGRDDWQLALPTQGTVVLGIDINAAKGMLDFSGAHLSDLNLKVNAGDARADLSRASTDGMSVEVNAGSASVALPSDTDTDGSITVNAGSVNICTPPDLGLRFNTSQGLAGTNFGGAGLQQNGGTWTSPNYDTAAHKADLSITVNFGSATLNPSGGCK